MTWEDPFTWKTPSIVGDSQRARFAIEDGQFVPSHPERREIELWFDPNGDGIQLERGDRWEFVLTDKGELIDVGKVDAQTKP
jgi:hypothetical protein